MVSNYKKDNMDLIVVTINDGNDWNSHRKLVDQLNEYAFITIFKKGLYDSKLDVTYYIYVEEDIVIPIQKKEEEKIRLEFKLLDKYAYVDIYLNDYLVCKKQLEVFNKKDFDIDLVIDLFRK